MNMDGKTKPLVFGRGIGVYHFIRDSILFGWFTMLMLIVFWIAVKPDRILLLGFMVMGFTFGLLLGALMAFPRLNEGRYDR